MAALDTLDGGVKILCVGLMRTGLKTLHESLRDLGYNNIYDREQVVSTYELWNDVLRNKADSSTFQNIFQGAEVVMGMPTFCFWEQILNLSPNARVILTVRDEDAWWKSVERAKAQMDQDLPGAPLKYGSMMQRVEAFIAPSYHMICEVLRFAWASTLGAHALAGEFLNESSARSNYRKHNTYVQSMLAGKTTLQGEPQLLVYNVKEGWEPLCNFLGKEVPNLPFPSVLQVPYFSGAADEGNALGSFDYTEELEGLLMHDSEFGVRMRRELRCSLFTCVVVLTVITAVVMVPLLLSLQVPLVLLVLTYLGVIHVGWTAYMVMYEFVMRVPALLVIPMVMKSLLIAGLLNSIYIVYGVLKEMLVTQDHVASPLLVLSSRFISVLCGSVVLYLSGQPLKLNAPLQCFASFAFTNEASTWAGYEMLRYVSFPVTVMAKSCKMLPNMMMGRYLNNSQYSLQQYIQATAAFICVAVMHLSDSEAVDEAINKASADTFSLMRAFTGVALLVIFFVTDSFTSQYQTKLYKRFPNLTQTEMMLGGNLLGLGCSVLSCLSRLSTTSQSVMQAISQPEVMWRIASLGLCGAMGQFVIYYAIKTLGPLSFTWIMTARQLLSVLISLVFFGHGLSLSKLLCITIVFGLMISRELKRMASSARSSESAQERRTARKHQMMKAQMSDKAPACKLLSSMDRSPLMSVSLPKKDQ